MALAICFVLAGAVLYIATALPPVGVRPTDAVVERLATAPGRLEPCTAHLRRDFEREVLFPAAERRRRAASV